MLVHERKGYALSLDEFYTAEDNLHLGEVATCLDKISSFASTARYLQLIAGAVSILSIGVVVLLHWKYPKLKNVYGFCLISLCFALAVTNLVPFLLEIRQIQGSPFTAITHYSWLSVFSWETIIIFHVHRSISGGNISNSIARAGFCSIKNITVQYAMFAWLAPIPFVLAGIICHVTRSGDFQYGRHWFEDNFISTYIFFIPTFCLIIVGISLFIATMSNMGKVRHNAEEAGGNPVDIMSIALRLQLTLGVPWVGFIILKFFPDPILLPVIVTINSLQGFFIMLALVTTKRVKRFIKDSYSTSPTIPTVA
ncbi:hypothetical protein BSL78_12163 [Apostichopus japonicus]|uniref:G-protein coupled receptors family 2 profile 2 domain-containing protein n=1 Tax=Stichopus japonicus TaxID=307972 RepID=A0A2G8KSG5_STIJA|nr:hypothetical protein BSL78_12163 [Apostichopus japonicus]